MKKTALLLSALLIAGVLTARMYFTANTVDEIELRRTRQGFRHCPLRRVEDGDGKVGIGAGRHAARDQLGRRRHVEQRRFVAGGFQAGDDAQAARIATEIRAATSS